MNGLTTQLNSLTTPQAAAKKLKELYPDNFVGVMFCPYTGIELVFVSVCEIQRLEYSDFENGRGYYPLAKPILHDLLVAFNLAVNKESVKEQLQEVLQKSNEAIKETVEQRKEEQKGQIKT